MLCCALSPSDIKQEAALEDFAIFLLVIFNHPNKDVKRAADTYLPQVTDKFPYLLWSGRVLTAALNLLHRLTVLQMESLAANARCACWHV